MSIYATVPGTLGRDSELRQTQGGPVLSFSIASEERVKGEKVTTWVRCSLFGKRGEALAQHLTKGSKVTAIGRLTQREYQGKWNLELAVDNIELQGGKPSGARQQSESSGGGEYGSTPAERAADDDLGW